MTDDYTQPFDRCCFVTIPGTAHGFTALTPDDITCYTADTPAQTLLPGHVAIDPVSQDVAITFVMAESGRIVVRNPQAREA